ncbi:MAG: hypothetical protein IJ619_06120 [Eubacterium sp.]|nr:hypothetical protein [Eubacterium sp.]
MTLDSFENNSLKVEGLDITDKMSTFNKSFDSNVKNVDGRFVNNSFYISKTQLSDWLGIENQMLSNISMDSVLANVKQMYEGVELPGGEKTLGIKEVGNWKGDISDKSILKSRAGYDAEIISTAKENIINKIFGNDITTYRADDRPDLFPRNDQYVDKIRVDSNGNIVERIQTKFIGDDGADCAKQLMGKDFDKYYEDGKVDKVEIPKDYYKDAKNYYETRRNKVQEQIDSAIKRGDSETLAKKQAELDRINKRDSMLEKSNTTSTEAIQAAKHPKQYAAKQMASAAIKEGFDGGVEQAKTAMMITGAISTVDNLSKYIEGDITAVDAVKNIAIDTGTAGAAGFGVGFISTSTGALMKSSSNKLIQEMGSVGNGCIPTAVVSYGIEVHDVVIDYAKGNIDNSEFVDELGRGGAKVVGGTIGGALGGYPGATIGSVVGEAAYDSAKYVSDIVVDLALGEKELNQLPTEVKAAIENKADETVEKAANEINKLVDKADEVKKIAEYVAEETGINDTLTEIKENVEDVVEETAGKTVETATDLEQSAKEIVSGAVNYAVTSEAYVSVVEACEGAVETVADDLSKLEKKAVEYADKATDAASKFGADAVRDVKAAFNDFNLKNSLPFTLA